MSLDFEDDQNTEQSKCTHLLRRINCSSFHVPKPETLLITPFNLRSSPFVVTMNPQILPDGWACMDKVMMIDDIEYTDEIQCTHIVEESCHNTYQTVFKATQVSSMSNNNWYPPS